MPIDPNIALSARAPQIEAPDPLQSYGRAMSLMNMLQQQKMGGIQLQQAEQEMADQQKMRQAYMESGGDLDKLRTRAAQLGVGPKSMMALDQSLLAHREKLSTIGKNELEVKKASAQAIGSAAQAVLQLPPEARPEGYARTRQNLIAQGMIKPEDAPEQYPGDEAMQLHANSARTSQQIIDGLLAERRVKAEEQRTSAAVTQANTGKDRLNAELPGIQARGQMSQMEAAGQAPIQPYQQAQLAAGAKRDAQAASYQNEMARQGRQRIGLQAQAQADMSLSPEGLDIAADQFAKTGQLPALGMGNAKTRTAIINRAAQKYPGLDLASASAEFGADKTSLTNMQKMRDSVVTFEKTATANLDLLLGQAKKIVESNSPLVNRPLRMIGNKMLGDAEVPAFEAARRVAVNEIAKVTSNPTLAGQLSDSARQEVESFIPQDATLGQVYRVAKILKQDMQNRHKFLDEGIKEIQGRIGRRGPAAAQKDLSNVSTEDLLKMLNGGK